MLSLRQILTGVPEDEFLAFFLGLLDSVGFKATSWQTMSAARFIIQMIARVGSDITYTIRDIQNGMYAGLADGPYADLLGKYTFSLARVEATPTFGQMKLTSEAAAPIHTWNDGELLIADAPEGEAANTYEVVGSGALNPGTSVTINVRATVPGARSARVPANSPDLVLWTPLIGVTVTNPPNPPTTPENNWVTLPGEDAETSGEGGRYNSRMLGRWDRTGVNNTDGAYRAWCLEALPALTRVSIRSGVGEGTVRIVGATAAGTLTGGQIQTIKDYLNGVSDGVGRRPINDVLEVVGANVIATPALDVQIIVRSPYSGDAIARVQAALAAFLGDPEASPIGGKKLLNWAVGRVLIADLYSVVMAEKGLLDVTFSPAVDINLDRDDIYAPPVSVTMLVQA